MKIENTKIVLDSNQDLVNPDLDEICVGKPSVFIGEGVEVQPVDWNTISVFDLGNEEHSEYLRRHG